MSLETCACPTGGAMSPEVLRNLCLKENEQGAQYMGPDR